MTFQPFSTAKAKLKRARRHTAELSDAADTYLKTKPALAISSVLETRDKTTLNMQVFFTTCMPEDFSGIFGDAIHNLRTSLDILANDLVAISGKVPKRVYYPFAECEGKLQAQIDDKLKGATPDLIEIVQATRPYRGGDEALRALHDLDVRDKHIAAIALATTSTSSAFTVKLTKPPRLDFSTKKFSRIPQDVVAKIGPTMPGFRSLGVLDDAEFEPVIDKGLPMGGDPIIRALDQLADLVEGIIQTFEAHCLTRDQRRTHTN